jgi:hypothetical protein
LSSLCPDIIDTKLLKQKEREWQPDPQVLSKWENMYNLQKDYMDRVLPKLQETMHYDNVITKKQKIEKIKLENAEMMRQFEDKVNRDVIRTSECAEPVDHSVMTPTVLAPSGLFDQSQSAMFNNSPLSVKLDDSNKAALGNAAKSFFESKAFAFKQDDKPDVINNSFDPSALIGDHNMKDMFKGLPLQPGVMIDYMGTSVGNENLPGGNGQNIADELKTSLNEIKRKLQLVKAKEDELNNSLKSQTAKLSKPTTPAANIAPTATTPTKSENHIRFSQTDKEENYEELANKELMKKKQELHINDIEMAEPVLNENSFQQLGGKILNPPTISFLLTGEDIHMSSGASGFEELLDKSQNFNLETQRRGRRRSRFPDPQWDCAELQISKIVKYLCEEEVSMSYQKYCKPILLQINTMIESFLYHDNNLEICQNLHMCPITVDI